MTDEDASKLTQDQVAEVGQFYATLLLLQGQDGISEDDRKAAISRLTKWQRASSGTFAEETLERCLAALGGDKGYVLPPPRLHTIELNVPVLDPLVKWE